MKNTFNIPKTFFSFLLASLLFWILINLSKEYTTNTNVSIAFINLPVNKTFITTPIKELQLTVKGSGFKLITNNISNKTVNLNLKEINYKKGNEYYFLSKKIQTNIQDQLKSGIQLININKDTIALKIGTLHSKTVPLKTNLDLSFQLGHDLSSPIKITPPSVLISGEKSLLKNITSLSLEKVSLKDLSENTIVSSNIKVPNNVRVNTSSAKININVNKFTEGEIEVPILIKNAPKEINIFPKKVKLICKIQLNKFEQLNPNLFKVECDYKLAKTNETNYLIPKVIALPDSVSLVRMIPKKIDFLIHK